jgi:hypothetical protein
MKRKHNIRNIITSGSGLVVALFVVGCASSGTRVVEEKGFIQLHHVRNTDEELNLNKGDAIAMACTKCKTVLYTTVDKPRARFLTSVERMQERRHYCPGCKSTITITGAGLNAKEEIKHTCGACGDDSVFCCATKPSSGPTKGMEKK